MKLMSLENDFEEHVIRVSLFLLAQEDGDSWI